MKKIILLSACALLLAGCDYSFNGKSSSKSSYEESTSVTDIHSYDEVSDRAIAWNDIFSQSESYYYVYFYSLTCSHCHDLKDTIIEYALTTSNAIYFCQESNYFSFREDVSDTIGLSSCENFAITGFPSIAVFNNHKVAENKGGVTAVKKTLNL